MSHYVASYWLLWVRSVCHPTAGIGSDLIRDKHCDVELLAEFLQFAQGLAETLLSFSEFSPATIVSSKWCHN